MDGSETVMQASMVKLQLEHARDSQDGWMDEGREGRMDAFPLSDSKPQEQLHRTNYSREKGEAWIEKQQ